MINYSCWIHLDIILALVGKTKQTTTWALRSCFLFQMLQKFLPFHMTLAPVDLKRPCETPTLWMRHKAHIVQEPLLLKYTWIEPKKQNHRKPHNCEEIKLKGFQVKPPKSWPEWTSTQVHHNSLTSQGLFPLLDAPSTS